MRPLRQRFPKDPITKTIWYSARSAVTTKGSPLTGPYHYLVRYWIAPEAEVRVLAWLDGGHTAEMAALPGFLSARRLRLEETDSLGWRAFCTIYTLESKTALDAYFANPIRERFKREAAAFAGVLRSERMWGAAEWQSGK